MIKTRIMPTPETLFEKLRAKMYGGIRKGMLKAAEFAAGELRRSVRDTFAGGRGGLARSFRPTIITDAPGKIYFGVFSDLIYAKIQEDGGTIYPKTRKYLAVPVSDKARRTVGLWPRHWPKGVLRFIKPKSGDPVLAEQAGKGGLLIHYALKPSVTIRGKGYVKGAEPKIRTTIRDILAESAARGE